MSEPMTEIQRDYILTMSRKAKLFYNMIQDDDELAERIKADGIDIDDFNKDEAKAHIKNLMKAVGKKYYGNHYHARRSWR